MTLAVLIKGLVGFSLILVMCLLFVLIIANEIIKIYETDEYAGLEELTPERIKASKMPTLDLYKEKTKEK